MHRFMGLVTFPVSCENGCGVVFKTAIKDKIINFWFYVCRLVITL